MKFEPAIYLDRLVKDVLLYGGRIVIRELESRRDLMALSENLIINSSGLGARELFDDKEMHPYKGQLTLLTPQPDVDYETAGGLASTSGYAGVSLHMSPRSDGIAPWRDRRVRRVVARAECGRTSKGRRRPHGALLLDAPPLEGHLIWIAVHY